MLLPYIRFVVYVVFLLEAVLSGADLYYWFAVGFGKPDHLFSPFLSFLDVPTMGSFVAFIVQFFFVYRIWVLSEKRWWWLLVCVIICLVNSFLKVPERPYHPSRSSPFSVHLGRSRQVSL